MITRPALSIYGFGAFRLDATKRLLLRDGEVLSITPKCFDILLVLVESGGALLSKDELMRRVWPDSFVEENNLTYNISVLRKALGERGSNHAYIVTIPGRGYRFVAEVREISEKSDESASVVPAPPLPVQRKTKSTVAVSVCVLVLFSSILVYWVARKPTATMDSPSPIKSIAVLPFKLLSAENNDPEMEYLSDGISESLINNLSQLGSIKVIARSSSFQYKGKEVDPQEVAQALGVEVIVTGRVLQRGEQLQISVELMDARDKTQVWGEHYNRKASDLLALQSEVSREIAGKLRLKLTNAEQQQLVKRETANPQAYELGLRGGFYAFKGGKENWLKAVEYFNQAISVDPDYARAYARLSMTYGTLGFRSKSMAAAEKALELDENLAEGHLAMANLYRDAWEWAAAEAKYKHAIELNPNLTRARNEYSDFLSYMGRSEQALVEIQRSRELDPLNFHTNISLSTILFFARRYDEALIQTKKTLELDQSFGFAYATLGLIYTAKGMYQEAIDAFEELNHLGGIDPVTQIYVGAAYVGAGERGKARAILKRLETSKENFSPFELAVLYTRLGEREKAFASLEKAYVEHDPQLRYLGVEPLYDPLRSDPRYQDLLRRVGFTP